MKQLGFLPFVRWRLRAISPTLVCFVLIKHIRRVSVMVIVPIKVKLHNDNFSEVDAKVRSVFICFDYDFPLE